MSALTIKIPEPIIDPITMAEESTRFRLFLNAGWLVSDMSAILGLSCLKDINSEKANVESQKLKVEYLITWHSNTIT
jgi:hypothetical protein